MAINTLKAAQEFTKQNISVLCAELLELGENGTLGEGKFRQLVRICSFANSSAMGLAEGLVKTEAMLCVSRKGDSEK